MATKKKTMWVPTEELVKLRDKGLSQREISKEVGLSRSAVQARLASVQKAKTIDVATNHKQVRRITNVSINRMETLDKLAVKLDAMFDAFSDWQNGENPTLQGILPPGSPKVSDTQILNRYFQTMKEMREQVNTYNQLMKNMFDYSIAVNFQQRMLDIIGQEAPDVKKKIMMAINMDANIRGMLQDSVKK